ncbi:hypothetical protein F5879DRAFT_952608 [Lentinula edodes]|nr:hypothetical protein F5879DRAFT_952608 [Lentinula edodes]
MHTQIPAELWLHIFQFVPRTIVKDLMSVNRTFFYAAMAERYKKINFFQKGDSMLRLVESLPFPPIQDCVRVLRVRPYFIQELLSEQGDEIPEDSDVIPHHSLSSVKGCFSSFANLIEYHLIWFELPKLENLPIDMLRAPLLASLHLRKLFLKTSLQKLESLLSFGDVLPQLEELNISVRRDHLHTQSAPNGSSEQAGFASLTSFLNRNKSSIRCFSFSSQDVLDCTPLFRSLQRYPVLHKLSLSIPTSTPHLGEPSCLSQWMSRHCPSLRTLTMNLRFVDNGLPWEESFKDWIQSFLSQVSLPELRSLKLTPGFHTESICLLVRHFANTLTSLDLSGNHMIFSEVVAVMKELTSFEREYRTEKTSKLSVLCLGPVSLCPELVDLFAETLPTLQQLDLKVKDAVPHKDEIAEYLMFRVTMTKRQSPAQIRRFFIAMRSRTYSHWTLPHITVWKSTMKTHWQYRRQYIQL